MTDLNNAIAAGRALVTASGARISKDELAIMLAICGRESGWDPTAVQPGGPIGSPLVGVGLWQITPGSQALLDPLNNARAAWSLMLRQDNPYEPWNLQADGRTLIWSTATLPGGAVVRAFPPSIYEYQIGEQAAEIIFPAPPAPSKKRATVVAIKTPHGVYVQGAGGLLHLLDTKGVECLSANGIEPIDDPTASIANAIGIADTQPE